MIAFIDDHREVYGVEPICRVLPIAPSTYLAHVARRIDAGKRSVRARRDAELKVAIQLVFAENFGVCGACKVWRQLRREGFAVARCTVERLMASLGLQGVIRGKPVRTTISEKAAPCPLITSTASSMRQSRTCSGSPTSPTWPPGPASSMSPS
jgi:transposase InsO family protein